MDMRHANPVFAAEPGKYTIWAVDAEGMPTQFPEQFESLGKAVDAMNQMGKDRTKRYLSITVFDSSGWAKEQLERLR